MDRRRISSTTQHRSLQMFGVATTQNLQAQMWVAAIHARCCWAFTDVTVMIPSPDVEGICLLKQNTEKAWPMKPIQIDDTQYERRPRHVTQDSHKKVIMLAKSVYYRPLEGTYYASVKASSSINLSS